MAEGDGGGIAGRGFHVDGIPCTAVLVRFFDKIRQKRGTIVRREIMLLLDVLRNTKLLEEFSMPFIDSQLIPITHCYRNEIP